MRCRACAGDRLDPVFGMSPMPLAGSFPATLEAAIAEPRYPLTWYWCADCGLVNVAPDIPSEAIFSTYSYAASTVPGLVRHHGEFAAWLAARHPGPTSVLEVGCNDGVLLRQLPRAWHKVGVDPSDVAAAAVDGSYLLVNAPFRGGLGRFDVVVSSNTLAHLSDIGAALDAIRDSLAPGGRAYIEVHDLAATLASGQWDTIYHEHKAEWSVPALLVAGLRHGLALEAWEHRPLHGGLIRATFRADPPPIPTAVERPDFSGLVATYAGRRDTAAYRTMLAGGVAYGAAGRASVYLNQLPELPIRYVVDAAPLRAGRYIAGVGIPVVPPEDFGDPDRALITAWNHAPDIMARHPDYHRWVTAW